MKSELSIEDCERTAQNFIECKEKEKTGIQSFSLSLIFSRSAQMDLSFLFVLEAKANPSALLRASTSRVWLRKKTRCEHSGETQVFITMPENKSSGSDFRQKVNFHRLPSMTSLNRINDRSDGKGEPTSASNVTNSSTLLFRLSLHFASSDRGKRDATRTRGRSIHGVQMNVPVITHSQMRTNQLLPRRLISLNEDPAHKWGVVVERWCEWSLSSLTIVSTMIIDNVSSYLSLPLASSDFDVHVDNDRSLFADNRLSAGCRIIHRKSMSSLGFNMERTKRLTLLSHGLWLYLCSRRSLWTRKASLICHHDDCRSFLPVLLVRIAKQTDNIIGWHSFLGSLSSR